MAAGFRSYAFSWFTGYAVPVDSPVTVCTCPEYKHDPTTGCTFTFDGTLSNGFKLDGSLSNQFKLDETLSNQFSGEQTLSNQWGRRNCNG